MMGKIRVFLLLYKTNYYMIEIILLYVLYDFR